MTVSHLTTGVDALWALVLSEMAIDGKTYNTLNLSTNQIIDQIVTDVGGSDVSYLTSTSTQMLAAAVNALAPGTASSLTMGYAALLAALVNALQSTSPNSPPDSPPVGGVALMADLSDANTNEAWVFW